MNSKVKMMQPQWARDLNQKGGTFNVQQFATTLSGTFILFIYLFTQGHDTQSLPDELRSPGRKKPIR